MAGAEYSAATKACSLGLDIPVEKQHVSHPVDVMWWGVESEMCKQEPPWWSPDRAWVCNL